MALFLRRDSSALIDSAVDDVLLGIIKRTGEVVLALGDAAARPGHRAWYRSEGWTDVEWGFSLLVTQGRICGMFVGSELNQTANRELSDAIAEELEQLLRSRFAPAYRRW